MAKGYVIFTENIQDESKLNEYAPKAFATFMGKGNVIALDANVDTKEGTWHGTRTVILEFESVDAANAWYHSPEYQEAIPLRQAAGDCNVAVVSGFDVPSGA